MLVARYNKTLLKYSAVAKLEDKANWTNITVSVRYTNLTKYVYELIAYLFRFRSLKLKETQESQHDKPFEDLSKSENILVNNNSSESQYDDIDTVGELGTDNFKTKFLNYEN